MLLAVLASLAAVPAANAVTYPAAGGNGFATGPEGWASVAASCSPGLLCTEQNFWTGAQGDPPGSLESRLDVLVNAGEIFQGQSTWESPPFVATTSGDGTLRYSRQVEENGLATLNPASGVEPVLVDLTSGKQTSLGTATLGSGNSAFTNRSISVPQDTLVPGHRYRLQMRSTTATSSAQVGLTGSISLRIDNVALTLKNEGPGGASGSEGVQFTGPSLSQRQIRKLLRRINWAAEFGRLAGGSVVSRRDCTILGTPRSDRIRGSVGNDVICGMGGNDRINGRGGIDLIDTGKGSDRASGSRGRDMIAGLAGRDRLNGGSGKDRVGGGRKSERMTGASGRDRLRGGSGRDRIAGNRGRDRISGGRGKDRLAGNSGRDRISGGRGRDRAVGGKRDRLRSVERPR